MATTKLRAKSEYSPEEIENNTVSETFRELPPPVLDRYNMNNDPEIYQRRRDIIREGCQSLGRNLTNSFTSKGYLVDPKYNLLYCPIPKCGSTFLSFSTGALMGPRKRNMLALKAEELKRLKRHEISLLVIREPFSRLLSAYENKLYQPNLSYWKAVSRSISFIYRYSNRQRYKYYGFNVTFVEFIKYILKVNDDGVILDEHFRPMHELCNPCIHNFTYIVRLETFKDDFSFVVNKLKQIYKDIDIKPDSLVGNFSSKNVAPHVRHLYATRTKLDQINFPFSKLMLRVWRSFQIRGFMSKHIEFPYTDDIANDVTEETFSQAIQDAIFASVNKTALKEQRTEALIQAYRDVPMSYMERLSEFVKEDCVLFGYDNRPKILFDRSLPATADFQYFAGL